MKNRSTIYPMLTAVINGEKGDGVDDLHEIRKELIRLFVERKSIMTTMNFFRSTLLTCPIDGANMFIVSVNGNSFVAQCDECAKRQCDKQGNSLSTRWNISFEIKETEPLVHNGGE